MEILEFQNEAEQNKYLLFYYLTRTFINAGATEKEAQDQAEQLMLEKASNLFGYHGLAWQLGKINIEFFCMYFLQDVFLPKESNAAAPIAEVHRELWKDIEETILGEGSDQLGRVLPRGTGKSAFGTFAPTIWCHAYGYKKYTLICSDIGSTAEKFIKDIKTTLLDNPYIEKAFGKLLDDKDKRFICNSTQLELTNKSFIEAISSSSPMRGRKYGNCRPDLIILDDYQSEDDVRTDDARSKKWKRYSDDVKYAAQRAVKRNGKIIKKGTTFIALGTLQHKECFYSRLMQLPTWKFKHRKGVLVENVDELFNSELWLKFKKILFNFKNECRLEDAKEFYWKNQKLMQYPLLWQEFWDCLDMAIDYYENPSSFKQEVQGDVNSIGEKKFKTIATESAEKIESHTFIKTMLCIDPAGTRTKTKNKDYFAFAVGSMCENNLKYIRKGEILQFTKNREFEDYINHTIALLRSYKDITHVGIEKNTYGGADAINLEQIIKRDIELSSRNIKIISFPQTKNKDDKIGTIVGKVNMGQIIFNEEDKDAIEQLREFTDCEHSLHDDFPDIVAELNTRIEEISSIKVQYSEDIYKKGMGLNSFESIFAKYKRGGGIF
ncbi:hypothetical protein [Clostridium novyi]|uniref:hypothetical protein n=1 Tax=Clostridium novyi TaxID=1542 RepID=UPI0004D768D2|nr:hypothetical protein [Clostridium novyi]KEI08054.1 hypothetical protein Z958_p0136 [Clostridium novyi B str. NCTC 9691]